MRDILCVACASDRHLLAPVQAEVGLGVRVFSRPVDPGKNRLLSVLPPDEVERLLPNFQQISFALGDVVYEFSGRLDYSTSQPLRLSLCFTLWKTGLRPKWD
jgi:hypothetical protein